MNELEERLVSAATEIIIRGLKEQEMTTQTTHAETTLQKDPSRGVLNERGSTHGDFEQNGIIMQQLKSAMRYHEGWKELNPYQREALEMIQHKIGRILCGDPNFQDHWTDIAGYARLVEERCPSSGKK